MNHIVSEAMLSQQRRSLPSLHRLFASKDKDEGFRSEIALTSELVGTGRSFPLLGLSYAGS